MDRLWRQATVTGDDRAVLRERDDAARRDEVVGGRPQAHADRGREVGRREDRIERPVPAEEVARRLLADAPDAGQAIGRIAAQDRVVHVAIARDPVLRGDPRLVDARELADAAERVEDADLRIADEREEVAVAGHDLDRSRRATRERGDGVLGLVPLGPRGREADRVEDLDDDRQLQRDLVGGSALFGDAMGLIAREGLDPEGRAPVGVERDEEAARTAVGDEAREETEEAVDGVRLGRAVGRADRGDRVIRPVREA